ncbi:hypothetical protein HDV04_000658 [Boothiomyces sp. JEL0838]|nr:hypothetical protein HDV04_000658 [Boothiomyces sp. JEL0838]
MDTKSKISQNVQVAVRIRNQFVNTANEKKVNYDGTAVVVKAESFDSIKKTFSSVVIHDPEKRKGAKVFTYDRVFNKNDSQEQVFAVVKPIIDRCMEGFNGCIFAYGQTGSGKTYTMQGSDLSNERGVMPRVIEQITAAIADGEKKGIEYNVTGSYLEIYQEQLRDLLVSDEEQGTLKFAERAKKVKNNAIINLDPQSRKIAELESEIARLKLLLSQCNCQKNNRVALNNSFVRKRQSKWWERFLCNRMTDFDVIPVQNTVESEGTICVENETLEITDQSSVYVLEDTSSTRSSTPFMTRTASSVKIMKKTKKSGQVVPFR